MTLPGADERLLITEHISEIFWMCTADLSQILYVSPTYERVWGRSCESLYRAPSSFLDLVHADDVAEVRELLQRCMGQGLPTEIEYRIVRDDGTVRWILDRGYPLPEEPGLPRRFVGFAQDITERKRAEAEAAALAERFRLVTRATSDGVWDWDMVTNAAWWSDTYYELWQYDRSTVPSYEAWSGRILPADRSRVLAGFARAIESGATAWSDEYGYTMPDGTVRAVFDRAYVLHDAGGKPVRMLGATMDITHRRDLETQLRHSQKMEAIGKLAGGVAHDFNNILQGMALEVSLASATPGVPADVVRRLEHLQEYVDNSASLTRQLLVFSRREQMQPRWLDVNEAISHLARMLHRILGEDIALRIELAPGVIPIHADPGMLDQVVLNLAVNARDAMPRGGTLSIRTSVHGDTVCIAVEDGGGGIAPDVLPHIFEPFFTTKEVGRGTGLGLAVAFGIVEQHHGRLEVETEVGRGTTMRTILPISREPAPVRELPGKAIRSMGSETILLVEDDAALRTLMRAVLERHGYRVFEASRASAALSTWDDVEGGVDLLLTDVVMPGGMNGKELAAQLELRRPGLKVIFASGYSRDFVEHPGAQHHLLIHKPVTVDTLLAAVRATLDAPS